MKKMAILALLLAFTVGCGSYEDTNNVNGNVEGSREELAEQMSESGLEVGSTPPSLALETLSGNIFDQEMIKDKKVIINFWASWCGPCRLEMPDMARLAEENPDDLVVVAVNLKEDNDSVEAFVEELGMQDFHVLLDRTGELSEQFQILALPTTYFLNTDGTIAYKHIGYMNYGQFANAYNNLE